MAVPVRACGVVSLATTEQYQARRISMTTVDAGIVRRDNGFLVRFEGTRLAMF